MAVQVESPVFHPAYSIGYPLTGRAGLTQEILSFTTALPTGFTATRSGTTASYVDSSGDWQQASANTARIHHDSSGNPLGLLIENTTTNKANHANFSPTTIGDIVATSGDGTASIVDDTAAIATATIDGSTFADLQNGNVIALGGGTTGTFYRLSVDTGNTNQHSFRIVARTTTTGYQGLVRQSDGDGQANWTTDTNYHEIVSEGLTPNASTRYLTAYVTAGKTVYIAATQYEECEIITSPIINSSAAGSNVRNRDNIVNSSASNLVNINNGAIVFTGNLYNIGNVEQGFFGVADDSGASDLAAMRAISGDGFTDAHLLSAGVDNFTDKIGKPLTDDTYVCGLIWNSTRAITFHGHGANFIKDETVTLPVVALNDFWLGRWKQYFGYADKLLVKQIDVFNGDASLADAISAFDSDIEKIYPIAGQSNGAYISKNQTVSTYTNAGEVEALSQMGTYWSTGRNGVCNMAVGGSALYQSEHPTLYWFEDETLATQGPLLVNFLEALKAHTSTKLLSIEWDQGESNGARSKADIKAGVKGIIDAVRSEVRSDIEMILSPLGRRSDDASGDAQYRRHSEAYLETVSENAYVHLAPNKKPLALYDETGVADAVHLSDAAQEERVKQSIRKLADLDGETVSGPVDGPTFGSASGAGTTTITVPVTFPTGITAITPTSGIEGFIYEDDGVPITINAATYSGGNITLTLASAGSGTQILYYCTDTGYGDTPANYARGNDSNTMPAQIAKVSVT